jgi:hypothetical protein
MKAQTVRNPSLTKEILLRKGDEPSGAWIGIRNAEETTGTKLSNSW